LISRQVTVCVAVLGGMADAVQRTAEGDWMSIATHSPVSGVIRARRQAAFAHAEAKAA